MTPLRLLRPRQRYHLTPATSFQQLLSLGVRHVHPSISSSRDLLAKYRRRQPMTVAPMPSTLPTVTTTDTPSPTLPPSPIPTLPSVDNKGNLPLRPRTPTSVPAVTLHVLDPPLIRSPAPALAITVAGVTIPPKPVPPGEEDCCMSGCVHCVYTVYAEELEEYTEALAAARQALIATGIPRAKWPESVRQRSDDAARQEKASVESAVDPTFAAFLALESKLKSKS